jgi:pyruvate,water dikinase
MALKEDVLGQFLGDETFPVEWSSETEKLLFWVYDDLHCPKPLSPMFEDIGGWWLSCDHMFRRFGTPFATDWIYKNVNGYLYTAAIPAEAGLSVETQEYDYRTNPIVPQDDAYAGTIGAYLGAVLPVYGDNFVDWWRDRFVPEMQRNFDYIEGMLDRKDALSLAELAVLLEDAIDMHDRHWKIHWMLNFAQLSATLNLRAVMEKTHGTIDEVLLGRLQNSANDRNWDKIRALWEMKEEVKSDEELGHI